MVLVAPGRNKIAVISALREALQTGLTKAKQLADVSDYRPVVVATGLGRAKAERVLRELHAARARTEIRQAATRR